MKRTDRFRMIKAYFDSFTKDEKNKIADLLMNFEHYEFINNYNHRYLIVLIEDKQSDTIHEFKQFIQSVYIPRCKKIINPI